MDPKGERFVRRENVARYLRLLERITDEKDRRQVEKLLAEEQRKQQEAGDFSAEGRQRQLE
jgi:transcriptional regulator of met regulon